MPVLSCLLVSGLAAELLAIVLFEIERLGCRSELYEVDGHGRIFRKDKW